MTNELERLKTTCLAQEAEIARLQAGFDELRKDIVIMSELTVFDEFDHGWIKAHKRMIVEINRITGESR